MLYVLTKNFPIKDALQRMIYEKLNFLVDQTQCMPTQFILLEV